MTKQDMRTYNEALALQKISAAAREKDGLVEAMGLCQEFMGLDTKAAYEFVKMLVTE